MKELMNELMNELKNEASKWLAGIVRHRPEEKNMIHVMNVRINKWTNEDG